MPLLDTDTLLEQWDKHKSISEGELSKQQEEAREAHSYTAGEQQIYRSSAQQKGPRSQVVFSKIKPFVDAVVGFMIQLRRKPEYRAKIMNSQQQEAYSSYMNAVSDYVRENANMDQVESRQNFEMLVTGYGATDTNILYEKNPDGEAISEVLRFDDVFWDPQSQEPNMLDARWVFRRKTFSLDEALERFPGSKQEDFEAYTTDTRSSYRYIPGGEYDKISAGGVQEEDLVQVYYYQWWQLDKYYRAENPLFSENIDPATASLLAQMMVAVQRNRAEVTDNRQVEDIFEFDPFAEFLVMTPTIRNDMKALFERFGIEMEEQEYLKKVYYTSMVSGETEFDSFKSPDQQGFTIKFKTGNYAPDKRVWYGMVAGMIDPARYANKALSEFLRVIASNAKGGVMFEEGAVDDPRRFEQQYAKTDAAVKVNPGALQNGMIQPKASAILPTGYDQVYQIADQSLEQTSGISREFLGTSANTQVSALLEAQRINQVVATLAGYFDAITLYQKEHARLMTTYIRMLAENSEGRMISLIGEDGARQYEMLSADRFADEYDIDIGEAPNTPAQRQETAQVVIELADKLFETGQNIYPFVIDYIPGLKQTDKAKIKQAILPDPQEVQAQQQAQAEQQAMDLAVQQSVAAAQQARAERDLAERERVLAQVDEVLAKTVKTLEEANQKVIENQVLKEQGAEAVNVTI